MERRRFLATFAVGAAAVLTGCAPDNINPACYTPEGCSPLTAAAGLNQYDLLKLAYNDAPPIDRRFAFEVLRNDQFVEPDPSEFKIAEAPEGTATERSYDPEQTELYTFADGETAVFYEVFDS
mgnify:CR=1 FL=1